MLHMIRQNAAGSVHVLARMLDVLGRVSEVERLADRVTTLARHADLVIAAARRDVPDPDDLADLEQRYRRFLRLAQGAILVPDGDEDGGARTRMASPQIVPTSA